MIPFGLSSLMTVSLPIGRRATKCFVPGASAIYLCNEGSGTTLRDSSGNNNHGTIVGATWVPEGLRFDGVNDYVTLGTSLLSANAPHSLVIYLTVDADSGSGVYFARSAGDFNNTTGFMLFRNGGGDTQFQQFDPAGSPQGNDPPALSSSVANMVAVMYDGVYTYGATNTARGEPCLSTYHPAPEQTLTVGKYSYLWAAFLKGTVHAMAIYPFAIGIGQLGRTYNTLREIGMQRGVPVGASVAAIVDPRPVTTISFDDGWESVYTAAYPIMEAAGIKGTAYVNSSTIGTAGFMTEAQLIELYAAGWDIANHAATHAALSGKTRAQQETELSTCAAYLDGLGLTRSSHHVAYPYGAWNADTLAAMAATGMLTGRTVDTNPDPLGTVTSLHLINNIVALVPVTTTHTTTGLLYKAVDKQIYNFFGHKIDDSGESIAWPASRLQGMCDYMVHAGVAPMTISQFYTYVQAGYSWPS